MSASPTPIRPAVAAPGTGFTAEEQAAFAHLRDIVGWLDLTYLERDEVVMSMVLAIMCQEHAILIGKPGTGKSALITDLARSIDLSTYYQLMTPFTLPEDLMGPISVKGLQNDVYRRVTSGRLPEAGIADLDEPFRSTPSVLNTLLTIMNEKMFDNGGVRVHVPLQSMFSGSNSVPTDEELMALWDRFTFRIFVSRLSDTARMEYMLRKSGNAPWPTCPPKLTSDELTLIQDAVPRVLIPVPLVETLAGLYKKLDNEGVEVSDRRIGKMFPLLQAAAALDGRDVVDEDDMLILNLTLWSDLKHRPIITKALSEIVQSVNGQAKELGDEAQTVWSNLQKTRKSGAPKAQIVAAALEAHEKFIDYVDTLAALQKTATKAGRATAKVDAILAHVEGLKQEIGKVVLGGK